MHCINTIMLSSLLYFSVFVINYCISLPIIDLSSEAELWLKVKGIENATSNEKMMAREVVYERDQKRKAENENGELRNQKSLIALPVEVLQVRDAIEKRIDWMYGGTGKPAGKTYVAALEDAVTSNEKHIISNLRIMEFRSVIQETSFEDMDSFVDIVKALYRYFSFGQAHKIAGSITQLPSYKDEERISKILTAAGVRLDLANIRAIQAFLKPCKELGKKAPGENERCIIFKTKFQRHTEQFKPEANISKEDILHAFPEIEPLRAAWVSYTDRKQTKVYEIQVEFETEEKAKNGFNNNHGWFKKFKVEPKLSPCYDEDSKDVVIEEIASCDDTVANPNGA